MLWGNTENDMTDRVRNAWGKIWCRIAGCRRERQWLTVKGVASATIATLMQDGWVPFGPERWVTPDRNKRADFGSGDPFVLGQLLREVKIHATQRLWDRAARRNDGKGLEKGRPNLALCKKVWGHLKQPR